MNIGTKMKIVDKLDIFIYIRRLHTYIVFNKFIKRTHNI